VSSGAIELAEGRGEEKEEEGEEEEEKKGVAPLLI
jgi:hypothetical protein